MVLDFLEVEVIEHYVIFDTSYDSATGLNGMFCRDGGPLLQLSWDVKRRTKVDIDTFEALRMTPRRGRDLLLSSSKRCQLLQQNDNSCHVGDRGLVLPSRGSFRRIQNPSFCCSRSYSSTRSNCHAKRTNQSRSKNMKLAPYTIGVGECCTARSYYDKHSKSKSRVAFNKQSFRVASKKQHREKQNEFQ